MRKKLKKFILFSPIIFCLLLNPLKVKAMDLKGPSFTNERILEDLKSLKKNTFYKNSQFWINKYNFLYAKDIEELKLQKDKQLYTINNKETSIFLNKNNVSKGFFYNLKKSFKYDSNKFVLLDFCKNDTSLEFNNVKTYPFYVVDNIEKQSKFAKSAIDVREGAADVYDKIFSLSLNDEVIVTGTTSTEFYRIEFDGKEGFVKKSLLSDEKIIVTESQTNETNNTINSSSHSYQILGNCKETKTMDTYVSKIPQNILNFILNNGWTLYLTSENIAKTEFGGAYKSVMGVTLLDSKVIKIEDRTNAIKNSLYHELGHAIDWYTGSIVCNYCNTSEFIDIYIAERNASLSLSGTSNQTISSTHEYFAECINQYISNASNFAKVCPSSYNYVANIIQNL